MNINLNKLEKSQVELLIELSKEEIKPYLERAATDISNKIKIEGFRPGKAPYEIVKQKVGEQQIYQEASQKAAEKTYSDAVIEKRMLTVGPPKIEILKLAPGNPFQYKATVALLPEVKLGDYNHLKTKKKAIKIEEKEIEKTLTDLQKSRQKEKAVTRPAREGDKIEIDFQVFLNKVPVENGQSKNIPVFLGEKNFIPGFEEKLIGATSGEEKEFSLRFPKEYHHKNLADREAEFKVKVKSVFETELPALDDEFAKSLGYFKDLRDLKEKLNKNLEEDAKVKEQQKFELALIEEVISHSSFGELPDVLIDSELNKMIVELKQGIENQGLKFEDYLRQLKKSSEEMKKEFKPQAEKRVKTALTLRKIALAENVEASQEEIAEELQQILNRYAGQENFLKEAQTEEFKDYLKNIIVNRKVFKLLTELVTKESNI